MFIFFFSLLKLLQKKNDSEFKKMLEIFHEIFFTFFAPSTMRTEKIED